MSDLALWLTYHAELEKLAPVEKEEMMEVTRSWKEEALQEGLQQGLQQGQQRLVSVITHQLERRFGPLGPDIGERIRALSSDQLESLGEALFDFTTAADLAKWLEER